jgi:hypothetical protein
VDVLDLRRGGIEWCLIGHTVSVRGSR